MTWVRWKARLFNAWDTLSAEFSHATRVVVTTLYVVLVVALIWKVIPLK